MISKSEVASFQSYLTDAKFSKNDFDVLMKRLPTTHDYILVSLKHKKIYHNWDEIKFDD
jgi:hypothetical protein